MHKNLHHTHLLFYAVVFLLSIFGYTCAKNHQITPRHSNVTSKNVSWYHFSWATLYVCDKVYIG